MGCFFVAGESDGGGAKMGYANGQLSDITINGRRTIEALDKLDKSIEKLDISTAKANKVMICLNTYMVILTVAVVVLTFVLLIKA
ncbi:MAG: hypothetical protein WCY36_05780 [Candidatus Omnitrophota bacterium]